jgi:hypothetical protein
VWKTVSANQFVKVVESIKQMVTVLNYQFYSSPSYVLYRQLHFLVTRSFNQKMETKHHEHKQCIIEFQAFRDNQDKFIVKELVILDLTTNVPYSFIFKPPYPFESCNSKSRRTNSWLTNHYHYISWNEGNIDYLRCESLIKHFCYQFQTIFTTGSEKTMWISKFTNNVVVDLKLPKELSNISVLPICLNIENSKHRTSNCSLSKVYKLSLHLQQYHPIWNVEGKAKVEGMSAI